MGRRIADKLREIEKSLNRFASPNKTPAEKAKELGLNHPVAERVIAAYSDDFDDVEANRDLDYFEATSVSGKDLIEIMSKVLPKGYNDFNVTKTKQLVEVMGDADYHIAREGSVCIYVKPKAKNYWLGSFEKIKADEKHFDGKKMMFRFWWD